MPVLAEPLNLGDLFRYEAPSLYLRDRVMVASGQNLSLGTVVGIVTATARFKQLGPSVGDDTQAAVGVLLQVYDTTLIDRDDDLVVARHAIVVYHALAWPDAITTTEKLTTIAQLKVLGMLIRQGVWS